MVIDVKRPCFMMSSSAACTTFSLVLSSAEVASSSSMMLGFLMMARAMAMRCFCPPESLPPPSPTWVLYPSPRVLVMKPGRPAGRVWAWLGFGLGLVDG